MKKLTIRENDDKQKLIKFLDKYFQTAPKSLIQKWIRTKKIKVNGKRAAIDTIVYEGDLVDLYIYDEEIEKWQSRKKSLTSKISIDIAFENQDVVIFDKPQNMLVHAANKEDYGKNVVDYLVSYLIEKKEYIPRLENTFKPALVNRIDRNTMGLVIGAKNRKTLVYLNDKLDSRLVKKYYLAIVEGHIKEEKKIENYLIKEDNRVRVDEKQGKKAITLVIPLAYKEGYSLVEIELLTGRTHQIRASLESIGHPIIGDRRYNKRRVNAAYKDQQLVAYKLEFSEDVEIESLKNLQVLSKYKDYIEGLFEEIRSRDVL